MPMNGRLRMINIKLPIHIEAMRPQNKSGFSTMTLGPGVMPMTTIAPIINAITGLGGIPSVSIGMKEVCAAALFALSGPATPSMAPCPNRSGVLETRFSSV